LGASGAALALATAAAAKTEAFIMVCC